MGPLRIIILAVLVYIGYRLLIGARKKETQSGKEKSNTNKSAGVSDILVEDPVCHILIPKGQAVHLQHHGSMVYFCSEDCCNTFIEKRKEK
jgi:YHS domain-containing protein